MQTPEEVGVGYLDVVEEMQVRPQSQEVLDRFLALIRARDAEVRADERAKVLAGFVEQKRTAHAWKPCDCPDAPDDWREENPHVDWSRSYEERRLVGSWERIPEDEVRSTPREAWTPCWERVPDDVVRKTMPALARALDEGEKGLT